MVIAWLIRLRWALAGLQEVPHLGTERWAFHPREEMWSSHKEQERLRDEIIQRGSW